ncbi:MAG: hypothetical protein R2774_02565 [Saprospiraceae bacterium]
MLKISFGKRPQPKEFGFKPRYYDPDKEDLKKRLERYKKSGDDAIYNDAEQIKERIKFGIHRKLYGGNTDVKKQEVRKSNLRLLYIIAVLLLVTYAILQSDKIANLIEIFQNN